MTGFEIPEFDLILQDAATANDPEDELPIEETAVAVSPTEVSENQTLRALLRSLWIACHSPGMHRAVIGIRRIGSDRTAAKIWSAMTPRASWGPGRRVSLSFNEISCFGVLRLCIIPLHVEIHHVFNIIPRRNHGLYLSHRNRSDVRGPRSCSAGEEFYLNS